MKISELTMTKQSLILVIKAVSNIEHEEKVNEEKRRIKVPRKEYIAEIAGQFKRLIKGR